MALQICHSDSLLSFLLLFMRDNDYFYPRVSSLVMEYVWFYQCTLIIPHTGKPTCISRNIVLLV